jgi:diketogulonate reductase-like aldo/keto reductase
VKSATPSRIISNVNLYDFVLGKEEMDELDSLDMGARGAISWNPVDAD